RVMFDNFDLRSLGIAVERNGKVFETEASGGVNLNTVRDIAETGVEFISVGALTHSFKALDISLDISAS
ncbi:MAG: nicotinate-nucleotide diphosphorylase (carboxylating), partial [Candidatus Kapaibacterium sp.]